jgi:hypothetical protein
MKRYGVLLAVLALVLSSLACQSFLGGADNVDVPAAPDSDNSSGNDDIPSPSEGPDNGGNTGAGGDSQFPLPDDAANVTTIAGTTNFQTHLDLEEAMNFYREKFGGQGYTERGILTVTSDATFSMVFDGDPSGKAIVVQGVDLGDGTTNISIRLEDS